MNGDVPTLVRHIDSIENGVNSTRSRFKKEVAPLLKTLKKGSNIKKSLFGGYSLKTTPKISHMNKVLANLRNRASVRTNLMNKLEKLRNQVGEVNT
jgi:hypothetical protein